MRIKHDQRFTLEKSSLITVALACLLTGVPGRTALAAEAAPVIVCPRESSWQENLAAQEVRRYLYVRTGQLLSIQTADETLPEAAAIIVARNGRPPGKALRSIPQLSEAQASLQAQEYLLKTVEVNNRPCLLLAGGDAAATLYAAYRFAEHLGIRFYLHGDVIPDGRIDLKIPALDEKSKPLFALRGIQPFHDFPEGPDWWNQDDYLAILSQLPKLRMNFFGLHTYPEARPNAEPTVWIGLPADVADDGRVKFSYPSSYQNTLRGNWGYAAKKTGDFVFGAADLFEWDAFGAEVMLDACPEPKTTEACNQVFDRTASLLREAFRHAQRLGVKTCVGTETPLIVPKAVQERLKAAGKNPDEPSVIQELYEGLFQRVAKAYSLDYYWFWTPEGWTWEGVKEAQVKAAIDDLFTAIVAARKAAPSLHLATCGWVLGPQQDRAMFDKVLPKEVAVSCINREVGKTPVDKGFADVSGRGKWAIPWLEDDPALTSPQLWVGRMRRDAADARRYGCDGLMGIHWRTRVLGPAVSALAQAAWNQDEWNRSPVQPVETPRQAGPVGGQVADYPNNPIADTEDDPLYQSVRYNLAAYYLPAPNGSYTVTLKFCEPHYQEAGRRVFDVKLQGKTVLEKLDIFAKAGQNHALDYRYENVTVTDGWLALEFVPQVEFPSIAAIVVQGAGVNQKINCGGSAYRDYVADSPGSAAPKAVFPSTADFYRDWAQQHFGAEVGSKAAAIFEKIDGDLPRPSDWIDGPGGIRPDQRPWELVAKEYEFVEQLAALRPEVKGAGNLERFDYWLNTFCYLKAMAHMNCVWAEYNRAMAKVKGEKDAAVQKESARQTALPLRRQLVRWVGEVYQRLLATVSNPGELGTVANWDQHLLPGLLTKPGEELAKILGEELPADAQPSKTYRGPTRVIVPTVRTSVQPGEGLSLKVIILSEKPLREAALYSRPMGQGQFVRISLVHVARGVYSAKLPQASAGDTGLEYYIQVAAEGGELVVFPATAPAINQTVVVAGR